MTNFVEYIKRVFLYDDKGAGGIDLYIFDPSFPHLVIRYVIISLAFMYDVYLFFTWYDV